MEESLGPDLVGLLVLVQKAAEVQEEIKDERKE